MIKYSVKIDVLHVNRSVPSEELIYSMTIPVDGKEEASAMQNFAESRFDTLMYLESRLSNWYSALRSSFLLITNGCTYDKFTVAVRADIIKQVVDTPSK